MSRFQIHDELTAPEGSLPIVKAAKHASGGRLPNFLGVLAGSPAVLRAYTRQRAELRQGKLPTATGERVALAVAEHHHSEPGLALHTRAARRAGLGIDEVALAREWDSHDPHQAALLRYLQAVVENHGAVAMHLHEEARESGWSDEEVLEAIALVALESFAAMVNVAGEIPADGSADDAGALRAETRALRAA